MGPRHQRPVPPGLDQRELPLGVLSPGIHLTEHLIEEADMAKSGSQEQRKARASKPRGGSRRRSAL